MVGLARCALHLGDAPRCLNDLGSIDWASVPLAGDRVEASLVESRAHFAAGRPAEAAKALGRAMDFARGTGDGYWIARALMTRVELAMAGLEVGSPVSDIDDAIARLAPMVDRWKSSLALGAELDRAQGLRARLVGQGGLDRA